MSVARAQDLVDLKREVAYSRVRVMGVPGLLVQPRALFTTNKMNSNTKITLRVLARIQQYNSFCPITGDSLAAEFQISWRKVASIVEELRDNGHKIGSSNGDAPGYFWARTPEELSPTITRMKDQAKKILARTNRMADWGNAEPSIFEQQEFIAQ